MKRFRKTDRILFIFLVLSVSLLMLVSTGCGDNNTSTGRRVDDWNSQETVTREEPKAAITTTTSSSKSVTAEAVSPRVSAQSVVESPRTSSGGNIGLSAGGAKDIGNFRENIRNNFLPLPTDVTCEGLFYDYFFDTGESGTCKKLFCPSYSYAVTADPFSGEPEYYLSVGLNSGLKESDFQRKKLNLVIVLDISGSMDNPFNQYYYDQFGNREQITGADTGKQKIEIATESIVALLNHLNNDDRFGMVVFNNNARLAKPLNSVETTDMQAIKNHILELSASGGTNLAAGMSMASELFEELKGADQDEYENRIIFLTDAMPNLGDTTQSGLLGMSSRNAENHVYTTFIGIGVDFNTELIEYISKMRGANYYSVHSSEQFRQRMDDEFEYMVTPLVFNLQLGFKAEGWKIEKVYGSPEASESTGELMKVNTLFPSKKTEGETRGGLILLKLKEVGEGGRIRLTASYEDRNGSPDSSEADFEISGESAEYYANTGIRKGVLLTRYANMLKNWMIDERENYSLNQPWEPVIDEEKGIIIPPELGRWERQSISLRVARPYRDLFGVFYRHFEQEKDILGDSTLQQELDILDILVGHQEASK